MTYLDNLYFTEDLVVVKDRAILSILNLELEHLVKGIEVQEEHQLGTTILFLLEVVEEQVQKLNLLHKHLILLAQVKVLMVVVV